MQKTILALAIILLTGISAVAQCDKKVKWQASRAEMLDANGQVVDKKEGTIILTVDSKNFALEIKEAPNDRLEGPVAETTCEWKEAFKTGKSTFKITQLQGAGDMNSASFVIEGRDGKVTIELQLEKMKVDGGKVVIYVDKYEII